MIFLVKSGNFGHQANADIYLQTVEIQMRSADQRIFAVSLVFFIIIIKIKNKRGRCPKSADCPNYPTWQKY